MEGKNCFRTRWSQIPLYSGGNIASLIIPTKPHDECLVLACGDTVNAVRASNGDLLASYTLPIEDVILRVDAVSIEPHEVTKRPKVSVPPMTSPPAGSYIAIGTRALQIYVLRLDVNPAVNEEADVEADVSIKDAEVRPDDGRLSCSLTPLRSWTAAQQAIAVVHFTPNGRYLVSGATDGGVKVWDVFNHHLTHNLRLPTSSPVHAVFVDPTERFLCVGSFEGHIAIFDFAAKVLRTHGRPHVAAVEALCLTPDASHIFSVGRDRKVSVGVLDDADELHEARAVAVKEHISSAVFETPFRLHIGATDGVVATYTVSATEALRLSRRLRPPATVPSADLDDIASELAVRSLLVAGRSKGLGEAALLHGLLDDGIASPLYCADAAFTVTRVEPAGSDTYSTGLALVGFLDQVLDVRQLPPVTGMGRIVVTNSRDVRCYTADGCLAARTLRGHSDIVLTCGVCADGEVIATAGKDGDVRFWSTSTWNTVAIGRGGHDADITAISFNSRPTATYRLLFSAGVDASLRLWDVGQRFAQAENDRAAKTEPIVLAHTFGIASAHEGPIHAMALAPNDQYVATAGKDRLVRLWSLRGKRLFSESTLKGHRRAVCCLAFSSADRVLASGANDGSVRLWSLVSLTCVRALQADRAPVLQLAFFNGGTQLVTGSAEGVLRVWAIAAAEVVWSGETHEDRIWALDVAEGNEGEKETIILSGSADGVLRATEDYTAEEAARVRTERHDLILQEQQLANALRTGQYTEAFLLALRLSHPRHLRQVVARWAAQDQKECEAALCQRIIPSLGEEELVRLLQFTREWVTNARHCGVASLVVKGVLVAHHFAELAAMPAARHVLEALLAYLQRHSQRLHETLRRTYYIDYVTRALGPPTLTSTPPFTTDTTAVHAETKALVMHTNPSNVPAAEATLYKNTRDAADEATVTESPNETAAAASRASPKTKKRRRTETST